MNTAEYRQVRDEIKLYLDGINRESVLLTQFVIAEVLHFERDGTPAHWEYSPGPFQDAVDADGAEYIIDTIRAASTQTLVHLGNVFDRYVRTLDTQGIY